MESGESQELLELRNERDYYRRQLDEITGLHLKVDFTLSNVRHELAQKRQGFSLLSELSRTLDSFRDVSAILDTTAQAVNRILGMDKTVVLVPDGSPGRFRPELWLGFPNNANPGLGEGDIDLPPGVANGSEILMVNSATPSDPFVQRVRELFGIPYFICTALLVEDTVLGAIISGRPSEMLPLYPPLDQGDIDSFRAMAGFVSASVGKVRLAALEEADRLKTRFFANISHEFRTPITLTLGPVEGMLAGRYGQVSITAREQLESIHRSQARLLNLINQILDLSKLESGKMKLRAERVEDLNGLVTTLARQFEPWADEAGLRLEIETSASLTGVDVYLDREKFDRILLNVLSNAFKFTTRGSIGVSTRLEGEWIRIGISDTGTGIREDQLPHVFDRFQQADGSRSRGHSGTGIGLSLVRQLTELHGGKVELQSRYGAGTSVFLSFPAGSSHLDPGSLVEGDPAPSAAPSGSPIRIPAVAALQDGTGSAQDMEETAALNGRALAAWDPGRPAILLADDNRDLRIYMQGLLSPHYNLLLSVDGEQALDLLGKNPVDLILSDFMMPKLSGPELREKVQGIPALQDVPFVLITAKTDFDSRIASLERGVDDYLNKPFSEVELLARVRNLIQLRRKHLRLRKELCAARALQRSLVPAGPVGFGTAQLDSLYFPADDLSGDFYDCLRDGEWIYLYLADVTSHGTAAAQVTYLIKSLFIELVRKFGAPALPDLMAAFASSFAAYRLEQAVALLVARFHLSTRRFELVRSGMPFPFRASGSGSRTLIVNASPLIDRDYQAASGSFDAQGEELEPGDAVYLFSDGCFEFQAKDTGRKFGSRRLLELLSPPRGERWATEILESLQAARGSPAFEDDLTILRFQVF